MNPTNEQIMETLEQIETLCSREVWHGDIKVLHEKIFWFFKERASLLQTVLQNAVAGQWQPIETAPKDGTQIYLDAPQLESGCTIGFYEKGHWRSAWDGKPFGIHVIGPTHWMPLPAPPAQPTTGDGE